MYFPDKSDTSVIFRLPNRLVSMTPSHEMRASLRFSEASIAPEMWDRYSGQAAQGAPVEGTVPSASVLQKAASSNPTRLRQQVIPSLPHLPAELRIDILSQAALNPLQLWALMSTGDASDALHGLQLLAGLNQYWITYTPAQDIANDAEEGAYVRAFIARYQMMTPYAQDLLFDLWAHKAGAVDRFAHLNTSDFNLMRAAVSQYGCALRYADPALWGDRALVLAAVSQNGHALRYADPELRSDRALVLAAVSQDAGALMHADPALCSDRALVFAAVSQDGYALTYADPVLRGDPELIQLAGRQ